MEERGVIQDSQDSSTKGKANLVAFCDRMTVSMNTRTATAVICMDFCEALVMIPHNVLLSNWEKKKKNVLLDCLPLSAGEPINAFEWVIQFQLNFTNCETHKIYKITFVFFKSLVKVREDRNSLSKGKKRSGQVEKLEVDPSKYSFPDVTKIIPEKERTGRGPINLQRQKVTEVKKSCVDFENIEDVPPLI
ncbi:hypothetical protein DUI87_07011 [Hirundo rustica rustica]|uniref:Uncharacterized protein n=1 Tax=Hirundo rustica rustica TaxID=333673 RepID=A0A3M0KNZ6_HIRRU|nr:hypothetical protein DUI87_07011 [Hirundo rustica rustica]